jgi:hypothetical protein
VLLAAQEELDHALAVVVLLPRHEERVLLLLPQREDLSDGRLIEVQTAVLHLLEQLLPLGVPTLLLKPLLAVSELSVQGDLCLKAVKKNLQLVFVGWLSEVSSQWFFSLLVVLYIGLEGLLRLEFESVGRFGGLFAVVRGVLEI